MEEMRINESIEWVPNLIGLMLEGRDTREPSHFLSAHHEVLEVHRRWWSPANQETTPQNETNIDGT